jgi:F-type H+-transporting ATPase subunit a
VFLLTANYIGLFPGLRPPTSDISTNLPLGITTFILIHSVGIKFQKWQYAKGLLSPFPIFLPFNIMGHLAKPISLSFRLFGNIVGGVIIIHLMYTMMPVFAIFFLPVVAHGFFDLFAGALQAFVFTMLSMSFIAQMAETE